MMDDLDLDVSDNVNSGQKTEDKEDSKDKIDIPI